MNARNMRHNREDVQPRWPAYLKEEESRSFTCVFRYHKQCFTCVQQRCEALGHAGKHIIFCFFFCVLQLYPWGSLLGEILAYVTVCCCCCSLFLFVCFFYSNYWDSHIRSSWMVHAGYVLLPIFTRLGHECQDLLSLCDGMHVCTD